MQQTCGRCIGTGLIGNGPNPHLLEGRTETCPDCHGTGKIGEVPAAPVDNSAPVAPKGGILGWMFSK